jgi:cell division transport system ATP-binding protein
MIQFKNVTKQYKGDIIALEDVSFSTDEGEFLFLVGHSGAGKSTILRLLIRQELPSEGEILFDDISVPGIPRKMLSIYRQQLGIVFQDLKLIPSKTIKENIQFPLEITNKSRKEMNETTDYLLELIGLENRSKLFPDALSGGEKQRVAIARALANDPKLFIADEPTGNLDPDTSAEILELLKTINSWGTTVMVVTHDVDIVDKMQTRVIHMEGGKLIEDRKGGYNSEKIPNKKKASSVKKTKPNEKK